MDFRQRQQFEYLRQLHQHQVVDLFELAIPNSSNTTAGQSYQERLAHFCQATLAQTSDRPPDSWLARLTNYQQRHRNIRRLLIVVMVVFGMSATVQAFTQLPASQLNVFWLLFVLLGMHWLSLLAWLLSFLFGRGNSLAFNGMQKYAEFFSHKAPANMAVYQTLLRTEWSGPRLRWMMASLTHSLWSAWLIGGFFMSTLYLSTHQVYFVWESTLLSQETFTHLGNLLGRLPAWLGVPVPSADIIAGSQMGADAAFLSQHKALWANWLLACLMLYGILPRLVLWTVSCWLYRQTGKQFSSPLEASLFIQLDQRLAPSSQWQGVVDPNTEKKPTASAELRVLTQNYTPSIPPKTALWAAFELTSQTPWPPAYVSKDTDMGRVDNREQQQRLIMALRQTPQLVLAVSGERAPDRGAARFLQLCLSIPNAQVYLMILSESVDARFQLQWKAMALSQNLPLDHVSLQRISASALHLDPILQDGLENVS